LADTANAQNAQAVRLKIDVRKWLASKLVPKVYGDRLDLTADLPAQKGPDEMSPLEIGWRVAFVLSRALRAKQMQDGTVHGSAVLPAPTPGPAEVALNPAPKVKS